MMEIIYEAELEQRLDTFLAEKLDESRSQLKKHIDSGEILVNGKQVKSGYNLSLGDKISILSLEKPQLELTPEDIPLDVVFENEDFAIINKKQGMVVHPAAGNYNKTLVNALLFRMKQLSSINGEYRPGIVHRLDKDTSGLIVIAKNDKAHNVLASQIEKKECKRYYLALVEGIVKDGGTLKTHLVRNPKDRKSYVVCDEKQGKYAETIYKVVEHYKHHTLLECELKTGRTHQIRVHCKHLGHPIVGDPVYGYAKQKIKCDGQLLHAYKLKLTNPKTNEEMQFECELPDYFKNILQKLEKN